MDKAIIATHVVDSETYDITLKKVGSYCVVGNRVFVEGSKWATVHCETTEEAQRVADVSNGKATGKIVLYRLYPTDTKRHARVEDYAPISVNSENVANVKGGFAMLDQKQIKNLEKHGNLEGKSRYIFKRTGEVLDRVTGEHVAYVRKAEGLPGEWEASFKSNFPDTHSYLGYTREEAVNHLFFNEEKRTKTGRFAPITKN